MPGTAIWADDKLGFSLEPLHRGFVFTTPITINIVENGLSQKVIYDPADFDFGKLQPPAAIGDLGFSGLRILSASDQGFEDAAIFQGASFFRSRARGQNFGVTARGLAIRTGDEPGEEFPLFREFWVEKPTPASNTLTMHALLDSQSVTGAFRFTIRPLETTIIDTEMTLIARVATDKLGIGAMAADYLFSALDHRRPDDWRAAVYEVTGLQMLSGNERMAVAAGRAIARPCRSPPSPTSTRAASACCSDRGASTPSTTTRAAGNCGRRCGSSRSATGAKATCACSKFRPPSENNANIIAQWRPKAGIAAGAHAVARLSPVLVLDAAVEAAARPCARRAAPARSAADRASPSKWSATCSPTRRRPRPRPPTFRPSPGKIVFGQALPL